MTNGFAAEQRRVALMMAAGLAITVASVSVALAAGSGGWAIERALAAAVLVPVAMLTVAVADVARRRFFSAADIDGIDATPAVRHANAVLRNTLEQAALAVPLYAVLAWSRPDNAALLLTLAVLFGVGRLLFAIGYARGPAARALGFALTFYPSVGALGVAVLATIAL